MNSAPDTETSRPASGQVDDWAAAAAAAAPAAPANWREALVGLIASRVALIQLESRQWRQEAAKRAACLAGLLLAVFFGWSLMLAGGIALLAAASGWPWHVIALAAAVIHLVVAGWLAQRARKPASPAFPVTRAEFQKDREWIENLNNPRKS